MHNHHHHHSVSGTRGLSHGRKLSPQAGHGKKDIKKGRQHAQKCAPQLWISTSMPVVEIKHTHTHTRSHTHALACTYVSSCRLQSFPGVCFTRHLCCLPGVFRAMLCVESSHASALRGLRWPGVAGCGYAC